jgi:hypothetical protein
MISLPPPRPEARFSSSSKAFRSQINGGVSIEAEPVEDSPTAELLTLEEAARYLPITDEQVAAFVGGHRRFPSFLASSCWRRIG